MRDAAAFSDPLYTMPVDLHVHSTRSDGTFTPTQLVSMAKEKGLAAFALTDHDSVNGIEEAMDASIDALSSPRSTRGRMSTSWGCTTIMRTRTFKAP